MLWWPAQWEKLWLNNTKKGIGTKECSSGLLSTLKSKFVANCTLSVYRLKNVHLAFYVHLSSGLRLLRLVINTKFFGPVMCWLTYSKKEQNNLYLWKIRVKKTSYYMTSILSIAKSCALYMMILSCQLLNMEKILSKF